MKNIILYAPLQYRYSLLSDKNLTIGLLKYVKNEGKMEFIEGEKELTYLQSIYPNLKPSLLTAYIQLIQKKTKKYPAEKHLDKVHFQKYIHQYILSADDSTLQFGEIDIQTDTKEQEYIKKYLPYTFESSGILQKFDALFEQHLSNLAQHFIHKNDKILPNSPLLFDRAWEISDISYFLWAIQLDFQNADAVLQKNIEKWQVLLNYDLPFKFEVHLWLIPPKDIQKTNEYIKEIQTKLSPLSPKIYLPEQWVEYTKNMTKKYLHKKKAQIYYISLPDEWRKEQKLQWFKDNPFKKIAFEKIIPDKNNNWLHLSDDNNWESLLPVCSKEKGINTIFNTICIGVNTARDEWVYDFDKEKLIKKMRFFIDTYNKELAKKKEDAVAEKEVSFNDKVAEEWNYAIKWSEHLKAVFQREKEIIFDEKLALKASYRPFVAKYYYAEKLVNDRLTQNHYDIFGEKLNKSNRLIGFLAGNRLDFCVISTNLLPNFASFSLDPAKWLPLYCYKDGNQTENITDWALQQFQAYYIQEGSSGSLSGVEMNPKNIEITKQAIFHYCYAVLHNPAYRQKYELNLKRDFPRIPFYTDFEKWAAWGKSLIELHIDYETVAPFPLTRKDVQAKQPKKKAENLLSDLEAPKALFEDEGEYTFVPKAKLKADKEQGHIIIDDLTTLTGVPAEAWEYKLGNRSALEWVLDQYKESKPSDPTIAAKFNTYKFADYKEVVIDLLLRVCTVSVETQRIVGEMGE